MIFLIELASRRVHLAGITTNPEHRPHQGIKQRAPDDTDPAGLAELGRPVTRNPVCGGLINQYHHAA